MMIRRTTSGNKHSDSGVSCSGAVLHWGSGKFCTPYPAEGSDGAEEVSANRNSLWVRNVCWNSPGLEKGGRLWSKWLSCLDTPPIIRFQCRLLQNSSSSLPCPLHSKIFCPPTHGKFGTKISLPSYLSVE
jgi:hypothetical protein